jgi:hypothetical protein
MAAMHRWLLVVMIALLPLRAWVGDAMAGEMLQQRVAVAAQQAVEAPSHDCMGHGQAAPAPHDEAAGNADCPTCASCQVCSAVALVVMPVSPAANVHSQVPPPSRERSHPSAERAPAFKPPIS